jgi:hypothetical protein
MLVAMEVSRLGFLNGIIPGARPWVIKAIAVNIKSNLVLVMLVIA